MSEEELEFDAYAPQKNRPGYVVVNHHLVGDRLALRHDEYLILRKCPLCQKTARAIVPAQGVWDWEHGKHIQDAFPNLDADQRELVLTGTHSECWNSLFEEEVYQ